MTTNFLIYDCMIVAHLSNDHVREMYFLVYTTFRVNQSSFVLMGVIAGAPFCAAFEPWSAPALGGLGRLAGKTVPTMVMPANTSLPLGSLGRRNSIGCC